MSLKHTDAGLLITLPGRLPALAGLHHEWMRGFISSQQNRPRLTCSRPTMARFPFFLYYRNFSRRRKIFKAGKDVNEGPIFFLHRNYVLYHARISFSFPLLFFSYPLFRGVGRHARNVHIAFTTTTASTTTPPLSYPPSTPPPPPLPRFLPRFISSFFLSLLQTSLPWSAGVT